MFNRDYLSRNLAWAFCVAPFACGLPLAFERLLSFVIAVENKGGGLFYAPTSLTEVALVLLILATAFPLLITVAVTVIPIAFVTQSMNIHLTGKLPFIEPAPSMDAPFTIAFGLGIAVQIITYAIVVRALIRTMMQRQELRLWKSHTSPD